MSDSSTLLAFTAEHEEHALVKMRLAFLSQNREKCITGRINLLWIQFESVHYNLVQSKIHPSFCGHLLDYLKQTSHIALIRILGAKAV